VASCSSRCGPSSGRGTRRAAVASVAGGRDVETLTEVLWAALHGLTTLGRNDRLRPGRETERIELLVAQFYDASSRNPEKRNPEKRNPEKR